MEAEDEGSSAEEHEEDCVAGDHYSLLAISELAATCTKEGPPETPAAQSASARGPSVRHGPLFLSSRGTVFVDDGLGHNCPWTACRKTSACVECGVSQGLHA